jgi:3'(2'), 5'-bisphosphate nucleotidase
MTDYSDLLPALDATAKRAGEAILAVYRTDFEVERKEDYSPVTQADLDAEAIILEELRRLTPDIPIVAEEEVSAGRLPEVGEIFWLVDPLDGTREFMNRNGEFTVNIALIENRHPTIGVVHAPERRLSFTGSVADGATRQEGDGAAQKITVRQPPEGGLTVVASRRHGSNTEIEKFLNGRSIANHISCGSSLKFCVVASGEADLYPRFGPTMEWDTAAGHAVLAAAGGCLTTPEGDEFLYRKPDFRNSNFIAWGGLRPD